MGRTFKLQKELLKTKMNHNEVDCNNYRDKKSECSDYVKQDVLCTAFSYGRYCKTMEEITEFSKKDSLSAPELGWKNFSSVRDENDEPIHTYNDKCMRHFVRLKTKRGRVRAFNQYYKSNVCGDFLKIIPRQLKVEGNVYDNIEAYMIYKNDHLKFIKEDYESNFRDHRDIDEEEMENYINKKLVNSHFFNFQNN